MLLFHDDENYSFFNLSGKPLGGVKFGLEKLEC